MLDRWLEELARDEEESEKLASMEDTFSNLSTPELMKLAGVEKEALAPSTIQLPTPPPATQPGSPPIPEEPPMPMGEETPPEEMMPEEEAGPETAGAAVAEEAATPLAGGAPVTPGQVGAAVGSGVATVMEMMGALSAGAEQMAAEEMPPEPSPEEQAMMEQQMAEDEAAQMQPAAEQAAPPPPPPAPGPMPASNPAVGGAGGMSMPPGAGPSGAQMPGMGGMGGMGMPGMTPKMSSVQPGSLRAKLAEVLADKEETPPVDPTVGADPVKTGSALPLEVYESAITKTAQAEGMEKDAWFVVPIGQGRPKRKSDPGGFGRGGKPVKAAFGAFGKAKSKGLGAVKDLLQEASDSIFSDRKLLVRTPDKDYKLKKRRHKEIYFNELQQLAQKHYTFQLSKKGSAEEGTEKDAFVAETALTAGGVLLGWGVAGKKGTQKAKDGKPRPSSLGGLKVLIPLVGPTLAGAHYKNMDTWQEEHLKQIDLDKESIKERVRRGEDKGVLKARRREAERALIRASRDYKRAKRKGGDTFTFDFSPSVEKNAWVWPAALGGAAGLAGGIGGTLGVQKIMKERKEGKIESALQQLPGPLGEFYAANPERRDEVADFMSRMPAAAKKPMGTFANVQFAPISDEMLGHMEELQKSGHVPPTYAGVLEKQAGAGSALRGMAEAANPFARFARRREGLEAAEMLRAFAGGPAPKATQVSGTGSVIEAALPGGGTRSFTRPEWLKHMEEHTALVDDALKRAPGLEAGARREGMIGAGLLAAPPLAIGGLAAGGGLAMSGMDANPSRKYDRAIARSERRAERAERMAARSQEKGASAQLRPFGIEKVALWGGLKGLFTRGADDVVSAATKAKPLPGQPGFKATKSGHQAASELAAANRAPMGLNDYLKWQQSQVVKAPARVREPGRLRGGEWIEGGFRAAT
jgi:hypothetical protein